MKRGRFTDYLLEKKLLSKEDLEKVLDFYKKKGGPLTELIVKLGYLKESQLVDALSVFLSIPPVRVLNLNISKEILNLIPERIARDYQVLPIGKIGNTLTLAMADPLNVLIIDDIKKITKCEVNAVVAPFSEMGEALSAHYIQTPTESIEDIIKGQETED